MTDKQKESEEGWRERGEERDRDRQTDRETETERNWFSNVD